MQEQEIKKCPFFKTACQEELCQLWVENDCAIVHIANSSRK